MNTIQAFVKALVLIALLSHTSIALADLRPSEKIWLARNCWDSLFGKPDNFRTMQSTFRAGCTPVPSRVGLDALHASGSAEFSCDNLDEVKKIASGYKLHVLDLREESHGLLNGRLPVSWFQGENHINRGKSLAQIEGDERERLKQLTRSGIAITYSMKYSAPGSLRKIGKKAETIKVRTAITESELCKQRNVHYVRIPVSDYHSPTPEAVDKFVAFARTLREKDWLHIHCAAGQGRTTTFLAMFDMMLNADKVSFEDIIKRQECIGGIDLLSTEVRPPWKVPYAIRRAEFISGFYEYCREQRSKSFATPWSRWGC